MARQKLGQHFLRSAAWRERIAEFLPRDADSFWIEIGAGHGEMTSLLVQRARRVIAIETDAALAATLRERFASSPNVEIVEADVLTVDFAELGRTDSRSAPCSLPGNPMNCHSEPAPMQSGRSEESAVSIKQKAKADPSSLRPLLAGKLLGMTSGEEVPPPGGGVKREGLRVYGNLPYYITSPILSHLFQFIAHEEIADAGAGNMDIGSTHPGDVHTASIHIVVQLEVAERITACPRRRDYGYLSALCQYFTEPELALKIPAGAFTPPPKVSSALVNMCVPGARAKLGLDTKSEAQFLDFLQLAFAHKRKTLRNNLRGAYSAADIENALRECRLVANARAEEIALTQFAEVFRALCKG